ncbi:MAG: carbohydrate ABC transporter permease [Proteobacteria bacterium]|nr:carbohydrate ABC transporter permease [Pseudomonadota bacterium]
MVYLMIVLGAVGMVMPLLYMISTSFKRYAYGLRFDAGLIPTNPTISNYPRVWQLSHFQIYFTNSLFIALTSVFFVVLFSAMMAYAFSRFEFPGREIIFFSILLVLMVPGMIGIIPQFLLAKTLGLRNSLWGLIIFYVAGSIPFNTFLLRGFFETLPRELEEAMLIDGGNYFTIFFRMVLPLSTPALATVSIFSFLGFWDEYILALTFIDDVSKRTLPISIALLHGQHATEWGMVFAASLIAVIPVIVIFVSLQRYFSGGIIAGAVKG